MSLRLGGGVYGLATEIDDPDGRWWTLISALDGAYTEEQVIDLVRRAYPDMKTEDLTGAIRELTAAGHIEDGAAQCPIDFTSRERERYDRSVRLYRWTDSHPRNNPWDIQRLLRDANVLIVGVGGAGGAVARSLAASGVGRLHCIDDDIVERSNLNRQTLYNEDDIGKSKAAAAVEHLQQLNPDVTITGEVRRLQTVEDFIQALDGHGFLVMCADQYGIRARVNLACIATGTPWVDTGYHGAIVTVGGYVTGDGPCWNCLRLAEDQRFRALGMTEEDRTNAAPKAPGHPVNAVTAGLSGELAAHLTIAMLTNAFPVVTNAVYSINLAALAEPLLLQHPRQDHCDACAGMW